jgi:hypothetical protein
MDVKGKTFTSAVDAKEQNQKWTVEMKEREVCWTGSSQNKRF